MATEKNEKLPAIHQIFISDSDVPDLPPYLKMAAETVRTNIPHSRYNIYSNADLQEWIGKEFGSSVLHAYNKLRPYAYRADLARLLLLYRYGGWYFDMGIRVLNGVSVGASVDLVAFLDLPHYSKVTFACANGIIYSKAGSAIIESAMEEALAKIHAESYGTNSLDITGPLVFGRAVAKYQDKKIIVAGTFMDLTPGMSNKNRAFVLGDGLIFALHKPGSHVGDMTTLGAKGTNNYSNMYHNKDVYNK